LQRKLKIWDKVLDNGSNSKSYAIVKKCGKCDSTWLRIKLSATLDIPSEYFKHLSKELIMEENVSIGINWQQHTIYCPNCGWYLAIDIP